MTPERALEILKANEETKIVAIYNSVKRKAIEALEKQIPKKPILDTIFPSGVEWYLCPTCNHNNIEKCDCYCHNCGQALDWSDTE